MSHKRAKAIRLHIMPMDKVREATKDMPGARRRVSRGEFMRGTTQYRDVKGYSHLRSRNYIVITLAKCARMVVQLAKRRGQWVLEASASGSS